MKLTKSVFDLAKKVLEEIQIPDKASEDAVHIAVATVNRIDYIMTWNFRHLANPHNFKRLRKVCEESGYSLPEICTPEELMGE